MVRCLIVETGIVSLETSSAIATDFPVGVLFGMNLREQFNHQLESVML